MNAQHPDERLDTRRDDLLDLIDYGIDNLTNARSYACGVGPYTRSEGCAILEGLLGARRRINQALELYLSEGTLTLEG